MRRDRSGHMIGDAAVTCVGAAAVTQSINDYKEEGLIQPSPILPLERQNATRGALRCAARPPGA